MQIRNYNFLKSFSFLKALAVKHSVLMSVLNEINRIVTGQRNIYLSISIEKLNRIN